MKTCFWRVIELWSAFSCQSPAGLGGCGEAKAPAGAVLCLVLWSLPCCLQQLGNWWGGFSCWLHANVWMPCCCRKGCMLPVCPFPACSTQDLPYSFPADTPYSISWDEIQACECKGERPVSVALKKKTGIEGQRNLWLQLIFWYPE